LVDDQRLTLLALNQAWKAKLEKGDSGGAGIWSLQHDFHNLLPKIPFASHDRLEPAGIGFVFKQRGFSRRSTVGPQAIEHMGKTGGGLKTLVPECQFKSIGRQRNPAKVLNQLCAGSRKANIWPMTLGELS